MILCIGDLIVDVIVQSGTVNYATDTEAKIVTSAGGQASNVAAWAANAGVPTSFIGKVGTDPFGHFLLDELQSQGVTALVDSDSRSETGKIILLIDEETKERSLITDRGVNLLLSEQDIQKYRQQVLSCTLLYLSGYSLFNENTFSGIRLAKELAVQANIPIALDPSSTYFLKTNKQPLLDFLDKITFFFPNYEEGMLLTGEENPKKIIKRLRDFVEVPILKLGEQGCLLFHDNSYIKIPAKTVDAVDTTGAGDSFAGTFLAQYSKTKNILDAASLAVDVSSNVVTQYGARPKINSSTGE